MDPRLRELQQQANEFAGREQTECAARDYRKLAEEMGFKVQTIVDSANSTGAYYEVLALYEPEEERIFGAKPVALIFEDYSRAAIAVWVMVVDDVDWVAGRYWRVVAPDGSLWAETSDEQEARGFRREGDRLKRNYVSRGEQEWREVD